MTPRSFSNAANHERCGAAFDPCQSLSGRNKRQEFAMKLPTCFLILLSAGLAATPLRAQDAGDAQRGLATSRQVCAECHAVQTGMLQSPNPKAPTFPELATTPGMTTTALTVALTTPHAGMPMFRLTGDQRADIIAYILSLRQSGSTPGK